MPGPVSDSYDPEFGTGHNAGIVRDGVTEVRDVIGRLIGDPALKDIVDVCESSSPGHRNCKFTERELRIIRFAMNRALESL
jgi:hypothetical protein